MLAPPHDSVLLPAQDMGHALLPTRDVWLVTGAVAPKHSRPYSTPMYRYVVAGLAESRDCAAAMQSSTDMESLAVTNVMA